jgi:chemotaxis protein CheZ
MPVQRKRFRIEEVGHENASMPETIEAGSMPYHDEIMSELRAIRAQMATPGSEPAAEAQPIKAENMHATLDAYRAQIEQCEKLKVELDLIHEAISRTKREIAVLHGKSFSGEEMMKVTGELGAVVGGTEEATQQILEAAEAIDEAASAMAKPQTADQTARLTQDIQERVITIFEACNFQDLTGQRITKVVATLKFIETHIVRMMEIWGGLEAFKDIKVEQIGEREGDAKLLNGPKIEGEAGHASQDDIDSLFA